MRKGRIKGIAIFTNIQNKDKKFYLFDANMAHFVVEISVLLNIPDI